MDRMLKQFGDAIQRLDKAHADERLVLRENAKLKLETQRLKGELDRTREELKRAREEDDEGASKQPRA